MKKAISTGTTKKMKLGLFLIKRQKEIIKNRACDDYINGISKLAFPQDKIPQLPQINQRLGEITGWAVEGVPALIGPKEFFTLLANKKFPAATFIRVPEELDYLQEPDIFHEIFGHTPMITNQIFADFMENFGKRALKYEGKKRSRMFRLFWFTVEFGLMKTQDGLRAYGSGILSSIGETQYCLSEKPVLKPFNVLDVFRTPFRIDIMQPLYFVLESIEDLFHVFEQDIDALLDEAIELGDYEPLFEPVSKKEPSPEVSNAMSC
jgi:phenylalanine-4-hydroxylase